MNLRIRLVNDPALRISAVCCVLLAALLVFQLTVQYVPTKKALEELETQLAEEKTRYVTYSMYVEDKLFIKQNKNHLDALLYKYDKKYSDTEFPHVLEELLHRNRIRLINENYTREKIHHNQSIVEVGVTGSGLSSDVVEFIAQLDRLNHLVVIAGLNMKADEEQNVVFVATLQVINRVVRETQ